MRQSCDWFGGHTVIAGGVVCGKHTGWVIQRRAPAGPVDLFRLGPNDLFDGSIVVRNKLRMHKNNTRHTMIHLLSWKIFIPLNIFWSATIRRVLTSDTAPLPSVTLYIYTTTVLTSSYECELGWSGLTSSICCSAVKHESCRSNKPEGFFMFSTHAPSMLCLLR